MAEFLMPSLGADMESGTLVEWLVAPGDAVHRGDVVAVVDTQKAAIDVEVFVDGVIEQLLVDPGARVPVGTPLATLVPIGAPHPEPAVAAAAPAPPPSPVVPPPVAAPPLVPAAGATARPEQGAVVSPLVRRAAREHHVDLRRVRGTGPGGRVLRTDVDHALARVPVSPYARRTAERLGVDLDTVAGTGRDGTVTAADVERAVTPIAPPPTPAPTPQTPAAPSQRPPSDAAQRLDRMRQQTAALMARSKREIPHYYLTTTVDMTTSLQWLEAHNATRPAPERLVPAALLLKAVAHAAREQPELNGYWIDDAFRPGDGVHLGVAISLRGGGLVVGNLRDADTAPLDELMTRLRDLVTHARAGRLRSSEMSEPTITVTNLGEQGAESVYGVIYPPQVALVGFGRVAERPWAADGMLGVRPTVVATLAADHRATDGHRGSLFLDRINRQLQRPEEL
jgi:pyruvate dehydrogenase E2 component (dihydrolipoamide acetyltransferase)